ncbi:hypothetical protein QT970_11220 [Microcoleus sp. herbarium8]|uniref:hypothetical protein n=1 Tax=Microcoleus sp. herbarium8 TaxID=3055436 RepID=UPI002FD6643D
MVAVAHQKKERSPFTPNTKHCDNFMSCMKRSYPAGRSPFLVSDERDIKMKERSPLVGN